ncbi:hypothetical protein B296_00052631, partial [Ensete ventricosum]
ERGNERSRRARKGEEIARDSWRRRWLNHKGYRTGNLRNIDNVSKAGQKHDAQQLLDERDTSHFRLLHQQPGLVP